MSSIEWIAFVYYVREIILFICDISIPNFMHIPMNQHENKKNKITRVSFAWQHSIKVWLFFCFIFIKLIVSIDIEYAIVIEFIGIYESFTNNNLPNDEWWWKAKIINSTLFHLSLLIVFFVHFYSFIIDVSNKWIHKQHFKIKKKKKSQKIIVEAMNTLQKW